MKEMVKRNYIKIPIRSGIPLYYWFLNGYNIPKRIYVLFIDVFALIIFLTTRNGIGIPK